MSDNAKDTSPNLNKIVVHDDYIEVIYDRDQNADQLHETNLAELEVIEKFRKDNKPVLVLADITHTGLPGLGVFNEGVKFLDSVKLDRLALYGNTSRFTLTLVNTAISTFSKDYEIKYYKDRAEALEWLRAKK